MKGKINIMVIGNGDDSMEVIKALEKIHRKHDCDVVLSREKDIEPEQFNPLTETKIPNGFNYTRPKQSDQWRGGSRGKGGKTKWPRR